MALIGTVPRRCVNLPPGGLGTLISCIVNRKVVQGPELELFRRDFAQWLKVPYVFGALMGRSVFQLALESLSLERDSEIIFPMFTFPVMPMVAKIMGFKPVFCEVDPETFNAGPEHIEAVINERTGAVLATHLYGRPCPIVEIKELAKAKGVRLMEDCAHALGVKVNGQRVGTFGDIGIFSFAEGKNMSCLGGGAIATADEEIAKRAEAIHQQTPAPDAGAVRKKAVNIWIKWLLTRPFIFGISAYQVLKLRLMMSKPLMDSAVGNELLEKFINSSPGISKLANIQAAIGIKHLEHIDAFNEGARQNARILTKYLGDVPGVKAPSAKEENHIYVYYPLTVDPDKRDDLRHYLLRHGVDTKRTDMSDCSLLTPFTDSKNQQSPRKGASGAAVLEICVYPVIPEKEMRRIARIIRKWANLPPVQGIKINIIHRKS
ncbi:MAG: DegT/DnrJ/EryC1/StrS family aminotransferase [Planctomycetota bacterium]|jgi:dTDP-4-amino-4,6-dideoxygalactose transaminase